MADDPGLADTRQGHQCTFVFVLFFFFSFPPLGFHGEEAVSSTFSFLELQSSQVLESQYSTLHSTVEFESGKWHVGSFLSFFFFFFFS